MVAPQSPKRRIYALMLVVGTSDSCISREDLVEFFVFFLSFSNECCYLCYCLLEQAGFLIFDFHTVLEFAFLYIYFFPLLCIYIFLGGHGFNINDSHVTAIALYMCLWIFIHKFIQQRVREMLKAGFPMTTCSLICVISGVRNCWCLSSLCYSCVSLNIWIMDVLP